MERDVKIKNLKIIRIDRKWRLVEWIEHETFKGWGRYRIIWPRRS